MASSELGTAESTREPFAPSSMIEGVLATQLDGAEPPGQTSGGSSMRTSDLSQQCSDTTSVGHMSQPPRSAKHVQIASLPDSGRDNYANEPAGGTRLSEGNLPAAPLPGQPSPEERVKLLMDAYSPRKSLSARSARVSPRPPDSSRRMNSAPVNSAAHGMLAKEVSIKR